MYADIRLHVRCNNSSDFKYDLVLVCDIVYFGRRKPDSAAKSACVLSENLRGWFVRSVIFFSNKLHCVSS
jgi:hypothetical protein